MVKKGLTFVGQHSTEDYKGKTQAQVFEECVSGYCKISTIQLLVR